MGEIERKKAKKIKVTFFLLSGADGGARTSERNPFVFFPFFPCQHQISNNDSTVFEPSNVPREGPQTRKK